MKEEITNPFGCIQGNIRHGQEPKHLVQSPFTNIVDDEDEVVFRFKKKDKKEKHIHDKDCCCHGHHHEHEHHHHEEKCCHKISTCINQGRLGYSK